jgi:hypothetical protein
MCVGCRVEGVGCFSPSPDTEVHYPRIFQASSIRWNRSILGRAELGCLRVMPASSARMIKNYLNCFSSYATVLL